MELQHASLEEDEYSGSSWVVYLMLHLYACVFNKLFLHQLTSLHQKAAEGDLKGVISLIEEGAKVNTVDSHSGVSCESLLFVLD